MNKQIILLFFISLVAFEEKANSQTKRTEQPLSLTINKASISPFKKKKEVGEVIKEVEENYVMTNIKIPFTKSVDEIRVEYFFDTTATGCSDKLCFGMIPIPGMYYQSEDKKKQFVGATTGSKTEFLFRYKF